MISIHLNPHKTENLNKGLIKDKIIPELSQDLEAISVEDKTFAFLSTNLKSSWKKIISWFLRYINNSLEG